MNQSRIDSVMESLTNVLIGLVISTIANHILLPLTLGVTPTLSQNIMIGLAFTVISIARSYTLRRLFNGKSAWAWLTVTWGRIFVRHIYIGGLCISRLVIGNRSYFLSCAPDPTGKSARVASTGRFM